MTDIDKLIPQRPPMRMVDTFFGGDAESCETGLSIGPDNVFCLEGKLIEPGLIEHMAQSAAAFSGFGAFMEGFPPRVGYLAEIKSFSIRRLPSVGEKLRTRISHVEEILGMTLVHGEVTSDGEKIAEGDLKVYIPELS